MIPTGRHRSQGKFNSGALLVIAMFLLGGIVMASFFYARVAIKPFRATTQATTR